MWIIIGLLFVFVIILIGVGKAQNREWDKAMRKADLDDATPENITPKQQQQPSAQVEPKPKLSLGGVSMEVKYMPSRRRTSNPRMVSPRQERQTDHSQYWIADGGVDFSDSSSSGGFGDGGCGGGDCGGCGGDGGGGGGGD